MSDSQRYLSSEELEPFVPVINLLVEKNRRLILQYGLDPSEVHAEMFLNLFRYGYKYDPSRSRMAYTAQLLNRAVYRLLEKRKRWTALHENVRAKKETMGEVLGKEVRHEINAWLKRGMADMTDAERKFLFLVGGGHAQREAFIEAFGHAPTSSSASALMKRLRRKLINANSGEVGGFVSEIFDSTPVVRRRKSRRNRR